MDHPFLDGMTFEVMVSNAELARVAHDLPWRSMDEDISVADRLLCLAVIAKRLEEDRAAVS